MKPRRDRPLGLGQHARPAEAESQSLRTGAGETVPNKEPNTCSFKKESPSDVLEALGGTTFCREENVSSPEWA